MLTSTNACEAFNVSLRPPVLKTMSCNAASSLIAETTIWASDDAANFWGALQAGPSGALAPLRIAGENVQVILLRGESFANRQSHFAEADPSNSEPVRHDPTFARWPSIQAQVVTLWSSSQARNAADTFANCVGTRRSQSERSDCEFFCHQDAALPWIITERVTNRTPYAVTLAAVAAGLGAATNATER